MPFKLGWPELVIVLVIVLILFGGRLANVAGELAKGIKIFQKNLSDDETSDVTDDTEAEKE